MSRFLLLIFVFLIHCVHGLAQNMYEVEGSVVDATTENPIFGANVYLLGLDRGTTTDSIGHFYIENSIDGISLVVSYIGYQKDTILVSYSDSNFYNVKLQPLNNLKEIVVIANPNKLVEKSQVTLPIKQIRQLPALVGEPDIIKVFQLFPGVQSGNEGSIGLHVRGGGPDQTLILFDDVPLYNPSHLFGFVSVFNPVLVKDVSISKSGFKAKYSGRLSSVVEVTSKDGDSIEYHGEASIGVVASTVFVSGPLIKDKVSFYLSGRRSHIDVLYRPLFNQSSSNFGEVDDFGAYYRDFNSKITWEINEKNKLSLNSFSGFDLYRLEVKDSRDSLSFNESQNRMTWRNTLHSMTYECEVIQNLATKVIGYYTGYLFDNFTHNNDLTLSTEKDTLSNELFSSNYRNQVKDIGLRSDTEYRINNNMNLSFGGSIIQHSFDPGSTDIHIDVNRNSSSIYTLDTIVSQNISKPLESNLYVENFQKIGKKLELRYGFNCSFLSIENKLYYSLQPRLSANYSLGINTEVFASYTVMGQQLQYLTSESIGLTWDQWLPSTESVTPQEAWQTSIGIKQVFSHGYTLTMDIYYKKMNNLITYKEGASIFSLGAWENIVTQGEGIAYGAEMLLEKTFGDFTGWIGYTLAYSNRRFSDKNFGEFYPYKFDRRHDISFVGNYSFNENVSISTSWVFGTGNAVTLADRNMNTLVYDDGEYGTKPISSFGGINSLRMPKYHRLDVGLSLKKERKKFSRVIRIGAYNAYNRKNPYLILLEDGYDEETNMVIPNSSLIQYSLFPIIPSISYSISF